MKINSPGTTKVGKVEAIDRNRLSGSGEPPLPNVRTKGGFALVVALIMVALAAVIAIGVMTSVSVERGTATSYNSRYQADLAVQNGLQAAAKTLAATPNGTNPITGKDTFLVVCADGTTDGSGGCARRADANPNKPAYYYVAQPPTGTASTITYYPLFSSSTNPNTPDIKTGNIVLDASDPRAAHAPFVPPPVPPANSSGPNDGSGTAWNAAGTQRLPTLYPWLQQPSPSPTPSGPSVKWVVVRDPQDPQNLPYSRYAYWVEDLDGYLDASQVGGQPRSIGTSPGEIAMFTIFDSVDQTDPGNTAATTLINNRPLLLTVPTLQQVAQSPSPAPSPDVAGPNLAVRLGVDNRWGNNPGGEQNLVPLGYGYGKDDTNQIGEGYPKTPINPVSQLGLSGNQAGKFGNLTTVMPNFVNRPGSGGHSRNYLNNISANLLDYAFPLDAPTEFMPPGNPSAPPSYRGIGAYPFVVSVYDLNNWAYTVAGSNLVAIETTTYLQIWNPHNYPTTGPDCLSNPNCGLGGALKVHYQNSDKVNVNGTLQTLSSPPDATIIFTVNPDPNNRNPVIISPLSETGNVGKPFNYLIKVGVGYQDPKGKIKPNEYRVIALPAPTPACLPSGRNTYGATGLPPGLSLHGGGRFAGLINGTPTLDPNVTYTNGYHDYSVQISVNTHSCGNATATLTIRIFQ